MMWSLFRKPLTLSPETEQKFENLRRLLQDDAEQISQYPDDLRDRLVAA
jgi:hypothetical protein